MSSSFEDFAIFASYIPHEVSDHMVSKEWYIDVNADSNTTRNAQEKK